MKKSEKILMAATKLWLQNSVKKTTMDDIAESANVSKMTIYKYYSDKDTLYLEVGSYLLASYSKQLMSISGSEAPLNEKMAQMITVVSAFAGSGDYALCQELVRYNDALQAPFDQYREAYERELYALIDAGVAEGKIRADIERQMIFYYIDMGIVYYQHNEHYRNHLNDDAAFQNQFMTFLMGNIFIEVIPAR
ncbi:TetR/AcrR family transcriptional regulator [Fusibacter paucivorans]|uniref:TetR/AcrR family transcriptional regulator n=1 Tax=Fusibacter paucivorans TaxID=76009 RepID=A0ABS5PML3_9FIRM|nr:TetR/AcrR family transcriptional regulator [Fusibacter paucivorans]MBS7526393.1 TetR/AcrR family transcriptional regulator [Fusibacter paucivorans]